MSPADVRSTAYNAITLIRETIADTSLDANEDLTLINSAVLCTNETRLVRYTRLLCIQLTQEWN